MIAAVSAFIIGVAVAMIWTSESEEAECEAKGGVLLRGNGFVCVDLKVVK